MSRGCDRLPEWLVQFRAPGGRIRARLRADDVALPETAGRWVPLRLGQLPELAPGVMEALIGAVVGRPDHLGRRQLARLHPAGRRDRCRDGHADLEVEHPRIHAQVVVEERPGWGEAL